MASTQTTGDVAKKAPRRRFTILKVISAGVIFLVLAAAASAFAAYYFWSVKTLPQIDGEIHVSGLNGTVTVGRDKWGVPYITASNQNDLLFAQGYVMAQDRLWQMDMYRRAANGRLSEILGSSQLDFDKRQREYGFRRAVDRSLKNMPPDMIVMLDWYARGVNAYIDEHRDNLPLEFHILQYEPETWKPADSLIMAKLMAEMLSSSWEKDEFRGRVLPRLDEQTQKYLYAEYTVDDQLLIGNNGNPDQQSPGQQPGQQNDNRNSSPLHRNISPANPASSVAGLYDVERKTFAELGLDADIAGSNNWVISGKKTTTGKPILANDPHLGHGIPSIWYQVELAISDGSYHVAGVTLPGTPGVILGHNDRIAWGATNFSADVQDLYAEEFNPQNPRQYRVGNEWRDAEIVHESIQVRHAMYSTATDTVDYPVTITRHGPIVGEQNGRKLALRWTALDPNDGFTAFVGVTHAKNWDDFQAALKQYPGPAQNFIYADVDGNIGYHVAANIPIRKSGDGSVPSDGSSDDGDWTGFVSFDELPQLYNPPQGWIATANNRITGKNYKPFLGNDWVSPYRAMRINDLIRTKEKLSPDDVRAIQADVYSVPDVHFAEAAQRILQKTSRKNDPAVQEILKITDRWDGILKPDSVQATLIVGMRDNFTNRILRGKLGDDADKYSWFNLAAGIDQLMNDEPAGMLPAGISGYDDLIIKSYQSVTEKLSSSMGSDRSKWTWGEAHPLIFRHPLGISVLGRLLNSAPLSMDGGPNTVNAYGFGRSSGVSMRLIVDLSDLDNSSQEITVGQSGQVSSEYYKDQVADWFAAKRHLFPFSDPAIEKASVHRLTMKP